MKIINFLIYKSSISIANFEFDLLACVITTWEYLGSFFIISVIKLMNLGSA